MWKFIITATVAVMALIQLLIVLVRPWQFILGSSIDPVLISLFDAATSVCVIVLTALAVLFIRDRCYQRSITTVRRRLEGIFQKDTGILDREQLLPQCHDLAECAELVADAFTSMMRQSGELSRQIAVRIEQLSGNANGVLNYAREQNISILNITASIETIAKEINMVAELSGMQAKDLNSLVNLIQGLSDTAVSSVDNIEGTVVSANTVADEAQRSQSGLNSATEEMIKIMDGTRDVGDALGLINDISDKINLLALNAAIEAARAGEAGRGFAVVADEVSKLADLTASSVKEIGSMLDASNKNLERNTRKIQEAVKSAGTIMERIQDFRVEIRKIAQDIKDQVSINEIVTREAHKIRGKSQEIDDATTDEKVAIYDVLTNANGIQVIFAEQLRVLKSMNSLVVELNDFPAKLSSLFEPVEALPPDILEDKKH